MDTEEAMDISEIKWPARRKRGRYSNEFKREVVKACQAPGVSTASVALANGMNANLLRRWVAEWGDGGRRREEQSEPAALTHKPEFVRLASEVRDMAAVHAKIELVVERGEYRVLASLCVNINLSQLILS
jgi:transposase-like protein